ncbi:hypothetical protein ALC57_11769 [Trachymyrmex cornetzi]|uniref:DUF8207 domain-containing protein n=1 Tax=Trachymyrmex cornetzi TaxID=471704 RepID=A0A151J220_9HYME|nr:hypothetical protein ALC57_11769 [Trachymyrmex cornetzi]
MFQNQLQTSEGRETLKASLGPLGQNYVEAVLRGVQDKESGIDHVYGVYLRKDGLMFGNKRFDVDDVDNIIIDGVRYAGIRRTAAAAVLATMKTKTKMGMKPKKKTTKKKTTKKRILPTVKRDGMLPFLPMLGALGSLTGGAASVAKAVNNSKAVRRQRENLQRHDRAMEQGRGLYLGPHKYGRGQGVTVKKKKRQRDDKNALGCNYQRAIGRARETYARTIL